MLFIGTAEKLAIKEYSASIGRSKDIMEYYINVLAEQGITSVAIWQPPSKQEGGAIEGVKAHPEDSTSSQVARLQVKDSSNAEDNDGSGRHKVYRFT